MIINEIVGNIFKSDSQTLVCPINMVGVMGKGLALDFAKQYPAILPFYKSHCSNKTFHEGKLVVYNLKPNQQALLFPTKEHWRQDSNLWLIERSLKELSLKYKELGITSLSIPKVGCGCGNLEFDAVKGLIYRYLDHIEIDVKIYV